MSTLFEACHACTLYMPLFEAWHVMHVERMPQTDSTDVMHVERMPASNRLNIVCLRHTLYMHNRCTLYMHNRLMHVERTSVWGRFDRGMALFEAGLIYVWLCLTLLYMYVSVWGRFDWYMYALCLRHVVHMCGSVWVMSCRLCLRHVVVEACRCVASCVAPRATVHLCVALFEACHAVWGNCMTCLKQARCTHVWLCLRHVMQLPLVVQLVVKLHVMHMWSTGIAQVIPLFVTCYAHVYICLLHVMHMCTSVCCMLCTCVHLFVTCYAHVYICLLHAMHMCTFVCYMLCTCVHLFVTCYAHVIHMCSCMWCRDIYDVNVSTSRHLRGDFHHTHTHDTHV